MPCNLACSALFELKQEAAFTFQTSLLQSIISTMILVSDSQSIDHQKLNQTKKGLDDVNGWLSSDRALLVKGQDSINNNRLMIRERLRQHGLM